MKLLTSFIFDENNIERFNEYIYCVQKNSQLQCIEKIIIFLENYNFLLNNKYKILNSQKVKIIPIFQRIKYYNLFQYAKIYRDQIIIISNGDIYFDQTLNKMKYANFNNIVYALTRYNYVNNKWELQGGGVMGSTDVWIFTNIKNFNSNYLTGINGVDSMINQKIKQAGIKVFNCCNDIICYHHHFIGNKKPTVYLDDSGRSYWHQKGYKSIKIKPSKLIMRNYNE